MDALPSLGSGAPGRQVPPSPSSKQMHEKAASLKSSTPSQEKPEASPKERNLETLDERTLFDAGAGGDQSTDWMMAFAELHRSPAPSPPFPRGQELEPVNQPEISKDEEKKCNREGIPNKYNNQYHKLFKDVPLDETVLKVCSCALQKDILIQGRLYISSNWLCFHANLFGKDIKVVIPVISVQMIKKHKMARLLPNGLAITTNTSRKYIFVSLISRDSVYDTLRRVCTHLQASSKKSLSVKEYPDEPDSESLEALVPEVKWRKVSPTSLSLSLPEGDFPCIHRTSASSLSTKESSFRSQEPLGSESTINTEEELEVETGCIAELRPLDYYLLKLFFVLICLLVVSSSYLAFRIFRLEQQLCSLNRDYLSHEHRMGLPAGHLVMLQTLTWKSPTTQPHPSSKHLGSRGVSGQGPAGFGMAW
ncbi:GRAM domain-containing protein 2A isoform X1 [Ornithorhynchus anatinus]|uniref:GRAM domain-containing protein 2A isoform X1 n=2 Tax=Ornithorhynchus anatinus TaxID=9258 RepID=UPI0010A8FCAE|nr:GRAM domain-containing protein 2A isoform X1 [Ornithorhynchus anatinus]